MTFLQSLLISMNEPLRSFNLYGLFIIEHEDHALILAVEYIDIFQVTVGRLGIENPDELIKKKSFWSESKYE
jgi:hypothetical protein